MKPIKESVGINEQSLVRLRNKRLSWSVLAAFLSRSCAVILQLTIVSVAVQQLGPTGFAHYSALNALAAAPCILMIRFGPSYIARFARSIATNNYGEQAALFWSVVGITLGFAVSISLLFAAWILLSPTSLLYMLPPTIQGNDLTKLLAIMILANLFTVFFNNIEQLQAAAQESYVLSIRSIFSSIISAATLYLLFPYSPTLHTLIFIVLLIPFFAQTLNSLSYAYRNPHLWHSSLQHVTRYSKSIFTDAVLFSVSAGVSAYVCHQLPVLLVTNKFPTLIASEFSALLSIVIGLFSVSTMLISPYLAALADSIARDDIFWAKRNSSRMALLLFVWGFAATVCFCVVSPHYFRWALPKLNSPSVLITLSAGIYLTAMTFESYLFLVNLVFRNDRFTALCYGVRALATALTTYISCELAFYPGVFWGGTLCAIAFSITPLGLSAARTLKAHESRITIAQV